jgi:hypothetical protein
VSKKTTSQKSRDTQINVELSKAGLACLERLKKRYGTKKNAVETALLTLEKSTI